MMNWQVIFSSVRSSMCICMWMDPPGLLYFTQLVNRFIRIFFRCSALLRT